MAEGSGGQDEGQDRTEAATPRRIEKAREVESDPPAQGDSIGRAHASDPQRLEPLPFRLAARWAASAFRIRPAWHGPCPTRNGVPILPIRARVQEWGSPDRPLWQPWQGQIGTWQELPGRCCPTLPDRRANAAQTAVLAGQMLRKGWGY